MKELSKEQTERNVELFTVYKDVGKLFIKIKYGKEPNNHYELSTEFWKPVIEIIYDLLWDSEKELCEILKESLKFQDSVEKAIAHLTPEEKNIMREHFGWEIFEFAEMNRDGQKKYIDKVLEPYKEGLEGW